MKAIGRNLIIEKIEEGTTETTGGLLLAGLHRDDIRYVKANVIEVGDEVTINTNDASYVEKAKK